MRHVRTLLLAATLLGALLPSASPVARADEDPRVDPRAVARRARELADRVLRHRGSPLALPALWDLRGERAGSLPGAADEAFALLSAERRLAPSIRWLAAWYAAGSSLDAMRLEEAVRRHEALGMVDEFWIVGPFDDEGRAGLRRRFEPERDPAAPPSPRATFEGKVRPVQWRRWTHEDAEARAARGGYVDLDEALWPREAVCAYASTTVELDRAGPVELWFGHGGAARLWWNGALALESDRYRRRAAPDRHAVRVTARRGANRVLVKVCVQEHGWGFYLRLARPGGAPLTAFRVAPGSQAAVGARGRPRPVPTPFSRLEAVADASDEGGEVDWKLLQAYVELARDSGADDPDRPRLPTLAERLAEGDPSLERLLLASRLARQRAEAWQWWKRASQLAPGDPRVALRRAELLDSGPTDRPALPVYLELVRKAPRGTRWTAARRAARLLLRQGLPWTGLRLLREVAEAQGRLATVSGVTAVAEALEAAGRLEQADALRARLLAWRPGDVRALRRRIGTLVALGRTEEALALATRYRRLVPSRWGLGAVAGWMERLGHPERAVEALQAAVRRAPQDPAMHRRLGEALLLLGRDEEAATAFEEALRLKPQQPRLRQLLALHRLEAGRPETGDRHPGERMAATKQDLLARRVQQPTHPATVLQDLTVQQIYENGLGSTFRQLAVQVHDAAGARAWRTYSVPYDPETQRVEVLGARVLRGDRELRARQTFTQEVGEASWRVYYDRRLLVVVLPALRPGDVLELRYRVDDVGHRNLFADYFGALRVLQRPIPVRHAEYVLISPTSRAIAHHAGGPVPLRHERKMEGDRRIDRWVGVDLPAVLQEPAMPGLPEAAAFVHVSTYESWEEVARWYWGLVEGQLQLDDRLRAVARRAVAEAPDTEGRVRRLYDWVLDNTRYVALEFGIHGYKPYRVVDVARRGFGDCKDKASLLYALLREAGIEAHLVLLRTRRNGRIPPEPASLAVFDHAIVYVPALDLYLDGTAEHNGLRELPPMDQGAMVLHVGPEVGELRTTPEAPPEAHRSERSWTVRLEPDGTAGGEVELHWAGTAAPAWREALEPEGTRQQRLERLLQEGHPGLRLSGVRLREGPGRNQPVRATGEVRVPGFARRQGSRLELPWMPGQQILQRLAPTASRRHPLELLPASTAVVRQQVRLPRGARLVPGPADATLEARWGRLVLERRLRGGRLHMRATLVMRTTRVEPGDYPAFRAWLQKVEEALRVPVTLEVDR